MSGGRAECGMGARGSSQSSSFKTCIRPSLNGSFPRSLRFAILPIDHRAIEASRHGQVGTTIGVLRGGLLVQIHTKSGHIGDMKIALLEVRRSGQNLVYNLGEEDHLLHAEV